MKRQLFTASGLLLLLAGSPALAQQGAAPSNSATQPTAAAPAAAAPAASAPTAQPTAAPSAATASSPAPAAAPATAGPAPTATAAPAPQPDPVTAPGATASANAATAQQKAPTDAAQVEPTSPKVANKKKSSRTAESNASAISLSPTAPQVSTLPGAVTPGFEQSVSVSPGDLKFDVHGLFVLPLAIGINSRDKAYEGQKSTTLHSPPVTPEDREGFNWTGVTPQPWVQMNFSYGNRDVTANVILSARTVTNANSYFNPPDYQGITDAFLTYRPPLARSINLSIDVGAFTNRYGHMGEYDAGRYGQSLIARLSGVGTNVRAMVPSGDVQLMLEGGIVGQIGKAPLGVEPAGWNAFADANVGSTYAAHGHIGARIAKQAEIVGHAIYAFEQDDRANPTDQADGSISILGADGHISAGYLGHLYLGVSHASAKNARGVSPVVRILEAPGGPGLMRTYFGPNSGGNGSLTTFGAQYDLSLGNLLSHPLAHDGDSPDLILSLFGIYTQVGSNQKAFDATNVGSDPTAHDGVKKLKYGAEATYSMLSWLAASARYDRVMADTSDDHQTYAVVSPRVIFHSDWNSQDQVVVQYSRYMVGSRVPVLSGYPATGSLYVIPDADVVSVTASIWW